jgi:hypothetical protein
LQNIAKFVCGITHLVFDDFDVGRRFGFSQLVYPPATGGQMDTTSPSCRAFCSRSSPQTK